MKLYIPAYLPRLDKVVLDLTIENNTDSHQIFKAGIDAPRRVDGYYFNAKKDQLVKIITAPVNDTTPPVYKCYLQAQYRPTPNVEEKRDIELMRTGILKYYDKEYSLLLLDNIEDKESSLFIRKHLKTLREKKTICVIKDNNEPVRNDRTNSFINQNAPSETKTNFNDLDPDQFGAEGYFREDDNLRCCGCDYSIDIDEFNEITSSSVDSARYLELINDDHEDSLSDVLSKRFNYAFNAKPCLRQSTGGNTFVSLKRNKSWIEMQRYLELEVHEESGGSVIRTVPDCSIIATQPKKQIKRLSDLPYEISELSQAVDFTFDDFNKALQQFSEPDKLLTETTKKLQEDQPYKSLQSNENAGSDSESETLPVTHEQLLLTNATPIKVVYGKMYIMRKLEPCIKNLYNKIKQWERKHISPPRTLSSSLLAGSPVVYHPDNQRSISTEAKGILKMLEWQGVSLHSKNEKEGFKQLLQELLKTIKELEPCKQSETTLNSLLLDNYSDDYQPSPVSSEKENTSFGIAEQGLAFLLQAIPPSPHTGDSAIHKTNETTMFADSNTCNTCNRESIESIEYLLQIFSELVLQPIIAILGDDFFNLDPEIREKIFLAPKTHQPVSECAKATQSNSPSLKRSTPVENNGSIDLSDNEPFVKKHKTDQADSETMVQY